MRVPSDGHRQVTARLLAPVSAGRVQSTPTSRLAYRMPFAGTDLQCVDLPERTSVLFSSSRKFLQEFGA